MSALKILLAILFAGISFVIPLYFYDLLYFIVGNIGIGWVISTILIRFLVILSFSITLFLLFSFSEKLAPLKFWIVLLIGLLPGFGISFISPIYVTDYGMIDDGLKIENPNELNKIAGNDIISGNNHKLIAFFTTTCPHCMFACEILAINEKAGQTIPVKLFFPGTKEDTEQFLANHNGENFEYFLIDSDSVFLELSGGTFPSIFLLNEKNETEYHWTGGEMNYSALDYLRSLE